MSATKVRSGAHGPNTNNRNPLVRIELDVKSIVADEVPEVGRHVDTTTATEIPSGANRDRALVTARFDAHASIDHGDLAEVAVTTERLHFFDLATGRAIR